MAALRRKSQTKPILSPALDQKMGTLRLQRGCQKNENRHRPAPEEHRQECLCYRGRARCFESWMTMLHQTRNSATESIPASPQPVRATVGSNTETDDDCRPATFHRGRFRCESSLLDPTVASDSQIANFRNSDVVETKENKNNLRLVIRPKWSEPSPEPPLNEI